MKLVAQFQTCKDNFNALLNDKETLKADFSNLHVIGRDLPVYDGQTVIIPSENVQTLETKNKIVNSQIVIKPIPNNYGKVSYNGAFLTVE